MCAVVKQRASLRLQQTAMTVHDRGWQHGHPWEESDKSVPGAVCLSVTLLPKGVQPRISSLEPATDFVLVRETRGKEGFSSSVIGAFRGAVRLGFRPWALSDAGYNGPPDDGLIRPMDRTRALR